MATKKQVAVIVATDVVTKSFEPIEPTKKIAWTDYRPGWHNLLRENWGRR